MVAAGVVRFLTHYSVPALFNPDPVRILSPTKKPTLVRTLVERIITTGHDLCKLSVLHCDDTLSDTAFWYESSWLHSGSDYSVIEQLRLCSAVKPTSMTLNFVELEEFHDLRPEQYPDFLSSCPALGHLKHFVFSLTINYERPCPWPDHPFQCYLTAAAANVEHLSFSYVDRDDYINNTHERSVSEFLGIDWHILQKLDLVFLDCRCRDLVRFLERHQDILVNLTLDFVCFSDQKEITYVNRKTKSVPV